MVHSLPLPVRLAGLMPRLSDVGPTTLVYMRLRLNAVPLKDVQPSPITT